VTRYTSTAIDKVKLKEYIQKSDDIKEVKEIVKVATINVTNPNIAKIENEEVRKSVERLITTSVGKLTLKELSTNKRREDEI
jgi:hypothetical protein